MKNLQCWKKGIANGLKKSAKEGRILSGIAETYIRALDLADIILDCFPRLSVKQGKMIFRVMENKRLVLKDGREVDGGTFRCTAALICSLIVDKRGLVSYEDGWDYVNFYCPQGVEYDEHNKVKKRWFNKRELEQTKLRILSHPLVKKIIEKDINGFRRFKKICSN